MSSSWFALYVKTRHEKVVAAALSGKGYETFLPLSRSFSGARSLSPLFPSYVFARFEAEKRLPVLMVPGVFQVVGTQTAPTPVEEYEIDALRRVVSSAMPCRRVPPLREGEPVTVTSGPLRGIHGRFVRDGSNQELVISVEAVNSGVAVRLDAGSVKAMGSTE